MLTQDYRPRIFRDLFGQRANVEVLKSIIKNPISSPKSLIFCGERGTGKTSSARILARYLNCERGEIEPCGICSVCQGGDEFSSYYQEFDASDVGSVSILKEIKQSFYSVSLDIRWKVVVFDEAHTASREAQSTLLKVLEEVPERVFFIFCTTDVGKLLPTIRSRSLELNYTILSQEDILKNLRRIVDLEGIDIEEQVLCRIASSSRGYARDSVKLLDSYVLMEDKSYFNSMVRTAEEDILLLLLDLKAMSKVDFERRLLSISSCPLDVVRLDLYQVLNNLLRVLVGSDIVSPYVDLYKRVSAGFGKDTVSLFKFFMNDFSVNSFNSDMTLQGLFWVLYYSLSGSKEEKSEVSSNFSRAVKR